MNGQRGVERFNEAYGLVDRTERRLTPTQLRNAVARAIDGFPDLTNLGTRVVNELLNDGGGPAVDIAKVALERNMAAKIRRRQQSASSGDHTTPARDAYGAPVFNGRILDIYNVSTQAELASVLSSQEIVRVMSDNASRRTLFSEYAQTARLSRHTYRHASALIGIFDKHSVVREEREIQLTEEYLAVDRLNHLMRVEGIRKGPVFEVFMTSSFSAHNPETPLTQTVQHFLQTLPEAQASPRERGLAVSSALMADITLGIRALDSK